MKKLLSIILLISHINSSMFFPAMDNDDINTVVEFVDEEVLENKDLTPADKEDENKQHYFSISKLTVDISCPEVFVHTFRACKILPPAIYSEYTIRSLPNVSIKKFWPPPDGLA